jgi:hypothetical protein
MGKASRSKRKRAVVRSAKRTKTNNLWYGIIAIIVIAGVMLIVVTNMTAAAPVGPYVANQNNPTDPHNKDSHWHAALGVYNCDHWLGDSTGEGIWNWPASTPSNSPARAGNTQVYAGLHSHDDGIIHMEPATNEEAGRHATVGKYFDFGGWKLSSTGYDFLGTKAKTGDKCGNGTGTFQWAVAKFNGDVNKPQSYKLMTGNPADWKLHNDEIIILALLPPGKTADKIGNPPSLKNLPDAATRGEQAMNNTPGLTVPTGSTPATSPTPATSATPTSAP